MFFKNRGAFLDGARAEDTKTLTYDDLSVDPVALATWSKAVYATAGKARGMLFYAENNPEGAAPYAEIADAVNAAFGPLVAVNGLVCIKTATTFDEHSVDAFIEAGYGSLFKDIESYALLLMVAMQEEPKATPTVTDKIVPNPETVVQRAKATLDLVKLMRDTYDELEAEVVELY